MKQEAPLPLLHRIRGVLATGRSLEDVFERTVRTLREGRGYFWIGIYTREDDRMIRRSFSGPVPPCHAFGLGQGNVGTTGLTGVTKVVPDVTCDETYSMCFVQVRSECVVPILGGDAILGVIDAESDQPGFFTAEDQSLLQETASLLSSAILRTGSGGGEDAVDRHGWEEDDEGDIGDEQVLDDSEEEE